MIPLGGSCYDAASYEYSPEDPPCDVRIQPFIKCTLEDDKGNTMLCLDYIEDINDPEDPATLEEVQTFYGADGGIASMFTRRG